MKITPKQICCNDWTVFILDHDDRVWMSKDSSQGTWTQMELPEDPEVKAYPLGTPEDWKGGVPDMLEQWESDQRNDQS